MIPIPSRLYVYAIGAVVLALVVAVGLHRVYRAGYDAADALAQRTIAEWRAQAEKARADEAERVSAANARAARIEASTNRRIAEAVRQASERARTLERTIRDHPDFAAVVRPSELERVRADDFTAIDDAASRSADLSASILRGLPAADQGDRKPGSD